MAYKKTKKMSKGMMVKKTKKMSKGGRTKMMNGGKMMKKTKKMLEVVLLEDNVYLISNIPHFNCCKEGVYTQSSKIPWEFYTLSPLQ